MNLRPIAFVILLATFLAATAHAQDQTAPPSSPPASSVPHPQRIRIGGNVALSQLVHKVDPVYPSDAKAAQVSGTVVLHAIIAKDGTIQKLDLVSGPPMLVKAATDAVSQWTYKPTKIDGEPVEVDTTITVLFTLGKTPEEREETPTFAPNDSNAPIDPQLRADILRLFDVIHLKQKAADMGRISFQSLRPTLLSMLPATLNREKIADAYADRLMALFDTQDFVDRSVALYAKYLTDDDVKGALEFYQSPAGQHLDAASPQITAGGAQLGQQLVADNLTNIFKGLCKDFPELQKTADFCQPDPTDRKSQLVDPIPPRFGN